MIVPPNEIAPPLPALVLITLGPVSVVGKAFVIVNEVAVILFAMLTLLVPAVEETNKAPSGVVPPTTPPNVIAPAVPEFRVNPCEPDTVPFTVLEKLMFAPAAMPPPFVLSNVGVTVKTTGPVIPIAPPAVVTFPLRLIAVEPV